MLETIITYMCVAFCSSGLSSFIDFCFEPKKILSFYYEWLCDKYIYKADEKGNIIDAHFLFYPLGGCLKCMNFYVSLPGFIVVTFNTAMPVWMGIITFFLYQGAAYSFLNLQIKWNE